MLTEALEFRIVSNPEPVFLGETIVGALGVDNLRAVPEPAPGYGAAAALAVLLWMRRLRVGSQA